MKVHVIHHVGSEMLFYNTVLQLCIEARNFEMPQQLLAFVLKVTSENTSHV